MDSSAKMEQALELTASVILPTFNRTQVLCDTLEMLLKQSVRAKEIIVIDQSNNWGEGDLERLEGLAREPSIILIKQAVPNASTARNRGAARATGDILIFLDDDILIRSDFIAAHVNSYDSANVHAIAGQILDDESPPTSTKPAPTGDVELDSFSFPQELC